MDKSKIEIEFRNISKTFINKNEPVVVLSSLNGKISRGSIVTIIGPSGSGKSTILSVCNLMATPDEGEVYIQEKEIRKWDIQELRRHVGIAFQAAPMIDGTVLDNLILPARLQGMELKDPEMYLQYVGLKDDLLPRSASELSGGQKQRLSLARTLVNKPDVLLLDEITSALDPQAVHEVEELILRINREQHTTILWVTHDQSQAERVGDQTWLVIDGRLIESAPTKQFFTAPKDSRTKEFINIKRVVR
ncbi:ABC transporter ATP-binding protein [Bacillus sp. Marseille-P3661]|uniref:ABC transporter ATP-binding protein n=1 Tax=Bacillus sp. Marseille-P3661 TaxID=1936234 RepID=UPI000C8309D5|nr:phosphate ABC transporter ATP-binding protein [Bacillus sp. Marseille-P3661]